MGFVEYRPLPGVHHIQDALGVCFTLIVGRERALLVDAGYGVEDVAAWVKSLTPLPVTLWLTHGHHDHALGAMGFERPRLHPADLEMYNNFTGRTQRLRALRLAREAGVSVNEAAYLSAPMPAPELKAGETMDLGGLTARIIPCPGHSRGSVVVYVPERRLLLTGDDWNPCTWVFFNESLPLKECVENARGLLDLPFEHVLCPHRTGLYHRAALEAFLGGVTDGAIAAARPVDTGDAFGLPTAQIDLPDGQILVFNPERVQPKTIASPGGMNFG